MSLDPIKHTIFGGCVLPKKFEQIHQQVLDLEVHDDDVWLCTFPRSGTTWTQESTWVLANNLDYEKAKSENLHMDRFPMVEISTLTISDRPADLDRINSMKQRRGRRFIKTHLPWQLLPKQIQNFEKKPFIIYVKRNVKDSANSYYVHLTKAHGYNFDFPTYIDLFIKDEVLYAPYYEHVASYFQHADQQHIKFLKYEEMSANQSEELRKLGEFLKIGYTISDEQMKPLLHHLSFDAMRNNKSTSLEVFRSYQKELDHDYNYVRKGQVGDYKAAFTPAMEKKFDAWIAASVKKFGLQNVESANYTV